MRKKILSVLMVLVVLVAFTACGKKQNEGVDNAALEQLQAALNNRPEYKKIDATIGAQFTANQGAQVIEAKVHSTMQLNAENMENPEMHVKGSATVNGLGESDNNLTVDMYMKDGYVYTEYMGVKQKVQVPITTLPKTSEDTEKTQLKLDATEFTKLVYTDAQGDDVGYELEFDTQKEDGQVKTLQQLLNNLIGRGSEATLEMKTVKVFMTTDKDNVLKDAKVEVNVRTTGGDINVDVAFTLSFQLNNTGDAVTITPPANLDSYTDFTLPSEVTSPL